MNGIAGATIAQGKTLYLDSADGKYKLADCDSATIAARSTVAIALNAASDGQPITVLEEGPITIGATLTAGTAYYQSPNAGGICPLADVLTGDTVTLIGIASSTTVIEVDIQESGVTL